MINLARADPQTYMLYRRFNKFSVPGMLIKFSRPSVRSIMRDWNHPNCGHRKMKSNTYLESIFFHSITINVALQHDICMHTCRNDPRGTTRLAPLATIPFFFFRSPLRLTISAK